MKHLIEMSTLQVQRVRCATCIYPEIIMDTKFRTLPSGPAGARQLARDLRCPMPVGFTWNFSEFLLSRSEGNDHCGCACGYVSVFYPGILPACSSNWIEKLGVHLGMTKSEALEIFVGVAGYYYSARLRDVTPEMVANVIDE
jgi:hypothetical protein